MKSSIVRLLLWLALVSPVLAQSPACTFKGSLTTATTGVPFANNSANPQCNSFALSWASTGFTALSIQLEGSNDGTTYAAYTGASTVIAGTVNPSTALSGAIIIQAQSQIAFVRVRLNSATGSGAVNWQVYGYNGVSNAAKNGGGGSGGVTGVTATDPIFSSGGTTPNLFAALTGTSIGNSLVVLASGAPPTAGDCAAWVSGAGGLYLGDAGGSCAAYPAVWTVGTGGVTANTLVCMSGNTVITCGSGTATSAPTIIGIALATRSAGGNVNVSPAGTVASCVFENAVTANHIVTSGTTTAGDCQDYGTTSVGALPVNRPFVGVALASGAASSTQLVAFFAPGAVGGQVLATSPLSSTGSTVSIPGLSGKQGSGNLLATSSGTPASGNCAEFDTSHTLVDAGAPCSSTSGNFGTIASGTNTTATMVIGSGAQLQPGGTGIIGATVVDDANQFPALTTIAAGGSPVDHVAVTNATTANPATVAVSAVGSDSNVNLNLVSKGTGAVLVNGSPIGSGGGTTIWTGTASPNGSSTQAGPHNMTSNTAPTPFVASADASVSSTYAAWKAFDGLSGSGCTTCAWVADATVGHWLQLDLGSGAAVILDSYSIAASASTTASGMIVGWIMQGSNDGTTWNTVSTVSSQTWTDTSTTSQVQTYTPTTKTTAYRYWRITSTQSGTGSFTQIGELSLFYIASSFTSGVAGDFYFQTSTNQWYGPRPSGASPIWPLIAFPTISGYQTSGTTFTASGCSNSTLVGGATAGSYHSGTTGTCAVTVTFGLTATNGWACAANDLTTNTDAQTQTATTTTTATISGTTVTGDIVNFHCIAY